MLFFELLEEHIWFNIITLYLVAYMPNEFIFPSQDYIRLVTFITIDITTYSMKQTNHFRYFFNIFKKYYLLITCSIRSSFNLFYICLVVCEVNNMFCTSEIVTKFITLVTFIIKFQLKDFWLSPRKFKD